MSETTHDDGGGGGSGENANPPLDRARVVLEAERNNQNHADAADGGDLQPTSGTVVSCHTADSPAAEPHAAERTIAGDSSSMHSIVRNEHSIMATMPRLAAAPRRTSTAASADKTLATTATTKATGHGDTRTNVRDRIVNSVLVSATSTADLLSAYATLRSMPRGITRARGIHFGAVAAAMVLCDVSPEVRFVDVPARSSTAR